MFNTADWHRILPFYIKRITMSANLIQLLQEQLNCPPLQKVDPNTQDTVPMGSEGHADPLMQAVIPSVLTGFYKLTRSKQGAALFLRGNISTSWATMLFGDNQQKVVSHIADYSGAEKATVIKQIETAANEAVSLITAHAAPDKAPTEDQIILFMKDQRGTILHYLPAALQIGGLLDDSTLDDHTNKMDGPVSGLMHSIEKAFSGTPASDETKK